MTESGVSIEAQLSWRYRMLFLFGLLALGPIVIMVLGPIWGNGLSTCIVKRTTGFECPGCGVTTSIVELLKGNWSAAIIANHTGPIIGLIVYGIVTYLIIVVPLKLKGLSWRTELKIFNVLEIISIIILIIAWTIRTYNKLNEHDQLPKVLQTNQTWWF
jgi:hypothetical protein